MLREFRAKVKHLQLRFMWVQEMTAEGLLLTEVIKTEVNPADLDTKHLDGKRVKFLIEQLPYGVPRRWLDVAMVACLVVSSVAAEFEIPIETPQCESGFPWTTMLLLIMAMVWWRSQTSRKQTVSTGTQTTFSAVQFGHYNKDELELLCRERNIVPARLKRDMMEQLSEDEACFVRFQR